jgi:hypothetical protein
MTDLETKHAKALIGVNYMTFAANYKLTRAVAAFEKRHGKPPRTSFIDGAYLKVGPEPKRDAAK